MNKKNKKIYLLILLFIVICLFFLTSDQFTDGILRLLHLKDVEKRAETLTEKETIKKLEGSTINDWYITYWNPSCFIPLSNEDYEYIGKSRIHWIQLLPNKPVQGSVLAGDETMTFNGTFDGEHIELIDTEFSKGAVSKPFTISADFSDDFESLAGTYTATFNYKGKPYNGCPPDGNVSGEVNARPCKNLEGTGCP